jgi:hypothetical protein
LKQFLVYNYVEWLKNEILFSKHARIKNENAREPILGYLTKCICNKKTRTEKNYVRAAEVSAVVVNISVLTSSKCILHCFIFVVIG